MEEGARGAGGGEVGAPASPTFEELELVYILDPRPDLGLKLGDHGTVVHAYKGTSAPVYLVEFVNPDDGSTRALTEFTADRLSRTPPVALNCGTEEKQEKRLL